MFARCRYSANTYIIIFLFFSFFSLNIKAQDSSVVVINGKQSNVTSRVRDYGELQLMQGKVLNNFAPAPTSALPAGSFNTPFISIAPNPNYVIFPSYNSSAINDNKINSILKKVIATWSQYLNFQLNSSLNNVIGINYDYYGTIPSTPVSTANMELGRVTVPNFGYPNLGNSAADIRLNSLNPIKNAFWPHNFSPPVDTVNCGEMFPKSFVRAYKKISYLWGAANGGRFDIKININRAVNWNFDTTQTNVNQYDFYSFLMKSIAIGLGMEVSLYGSYANGYIGKIKNSVTNAYLNDSLCYASSSISQEVFSSNLIFVGTNAKAQNGNVFVKVKADTNGFALNGSNTFQNSIYLQENIYPRGNVNSLMTPLLETGEEIRTPGKVSLGILKDIGWDINYDGFLNADPVIFCNKQIKLNFYYPAVAGGLSSNTIYELQRSAFNNPFSPTSPIIYNTSGAGLKSFIDTVSFGKTYYYRVKVKNNFGIFVTYSNVFSLTMPPYGLTISGIAIFNPCSAADRNIKSTILPSIIASTTVNQLQIEQLHDNEVKYQIFSSGGQLLESFSHFEAGVFIQTLNNKFTTGIYQVLQLFNDGSKHSSRIVIY